MKIKKIMFAVVAGAIMVMPLTEDIFKWDKSEVVSASEYLEAISNKYIDYKAVYKNQLKKLSNICKNSKVHYYTHSYSLFDMDYDSIPELIVDMSTCEADRKTIIYSADSNGLIELGSDFPGFHSSFAVDKKTNLFVTEWSHQGACGVYWYKKTSNKVTIIKTEKFNVDDFDNDFDKAFSHYGEFKPLEKFDFDDLSPLNEDNNSSLGDANKDGKLNVQDAAYIAKMISQRKSDKLPISADFNKDGKINVSDAAAIARYLADKKK